MPRISTEELRARLGKGKKEPGILLLGDEAFLRDACRAALIETYVEEAARSWALSRFSAERGETQAAIDQAQTLPMLSPQQVVFLEEAEAIEKLGEKKREETVKTLLGYLENPAPFTVLVVEASKLDMRMQLGKKLAEAMLVVEVGLGDKIEEKVAGATTMAKSLATEMGLTFEKGAAEDLAESVAGNLTRLKTEIEKLASFVGERKVIKKEDVANLVISEKAATIWQVTGMLAAGNAKGALEFFDRLLREGEEPVAMIGALAWMYRKIIEATEVRAANPYAAAGQLKMRPEQAQAALDCARKIPRAKLMRGMRALRDADSALKGGGDERYVLEFLAWELGGR